MRVDLPLGKKTVENQDWAAGPLHAAGPSGHGPAFSKTPPPYSPGSFGKVLLEEKVSITAQNVQEIVWNIGGEIRWTFPRYRYSSVFPSVRDLFKDVLPDSTKTAVIKC